MTVVWPVFLDMLAKARRPFVPFDFETCGLGGAPPVEFAALIFSPWEDPVDDAVSNAARARLGPYARGLTYATAARVNPGCPIPAEATAKHGIRDADVAGCPRWDAPAFADYWRELTSDGPPILCGHNIAEADIPWAERWGWCGDPAATGADVVDTKRLAVRLAEEYPRPLALDLWGTPEAPRPPPVVAHGLTPYKASLEGLHVALTDRPVDDAHGALPDACASTVCFGLILDLWAPMWPTLGLADLLRALAAPPPRAPCWDGWVDLGTPVAATQRRLQTATFARGKHKGQPLKKADAGYLRWLASLPRRPTCPANPADSDLWLGPESRALLGVP